MANESDFLHMLEGKNFLAWTTDARSLLSGGSGTNRPNKEWIRKLHLVSAGGLEDFERHGAAILSSPRGHGKSIFLSRRAVFVLLDNPSNYATLRENSPFVNELASNSIVIPSKQVRALTSIPRWEVLWRCTLLAHVASMVLRERNIVIAATSEGTGETLQTHFRASSVPLPSQAGQLSYSDFVQQVWTESAGQVESIAPALSALIAAGYTGDILEPWIDAFKKVILSGRAGTQISIYVDAIDEAFGVDVADKDGVIKREGLILRAKNTDEVTYPAEVALEIWLSAQKGFLWAVHRIRATYPDIDIRGTVRIEAVHSLTNEDYMALGTNRTKSMGTLLAKLNYTKTALRNVFDLNVAATNPIQLEKRDGEDAATRLFGFHKVRHSRVYGSVEELFDLILRHTFGSPRDLVSITSEAMKSVEAGERRKNAGVILEAIDRAAIDVFEDWNMSVLPVFDSALEHASKRIPRNIVRTTEIGALEKELGMEGLFDRLYSRGLIGHPNETVKSGERELQFFRPDGREHELPANVDYIALHPAFSSWICASREVAVDRDEFYVQTFIIGNDLVCPSKLPTARLVLDMTEQGGWTLENRSIGKKCELHSADQFLTGGTYERRFESRELICSMILTLKQRKARGGLKIDDLKAESGNLSAVGLYQEFIKGRELSYWWSKIWEKNYKDQLVRDLTKELEPLDLALLFHSGTSDKEKEPQLPGRIELCWRNGSEHPKGWIPVEADDLEIRVHQKREVE